MNQILQNKKSLKISFLFLTSLAVGFLLIGIWLWFGSLEESITGMGQLMPEDKLRRVMSPMNGIVVNVLVEENKEVKKGDALIELDPELSEVDKNSVAEQLEYLNAENEALKAAALNSKTGSSNLGSSQSAWLEATRKAYNAQLSAAKMQIPRLEHLLQESKEREKQVKSILDSSEKRLIQYKTLYEEAGISENEYREFEQKVIEQRGELASRREEAQARQIELEQAKQNLQEVNGNYNKEILSKLLDREQSLLRLKGDLAKSNVSLKHLVITAPIDGTVNEQAVKGIGEVVNPGEVLLSLVPKDTKMIAEVKVTNKDLAYIHLGQSAALRLDALPYNKFGRLSGKVIAISPSTQLDKEGTPFYIIRIKPDKSIMVSEKGQKYPLRAGMTLSADIITREKNILSFFTEPIHYQFDRAFRDPSDR